VHLPLFNPYALPLQLPELHVASFQQFVPFVIPVQKYLTGVEA
jgi:hypothetical protein